MRCCCSAVTHAGIDGLVLGGDAAARNNGWSRGMNDCRPAAKICGEEAGGSGRDARDSPGEAASCCRRSNSVSRRSPNAGDSGSWETSAGESPIGKPSLPRTFPPLGVTRLWGLEWQPAALRQGHERFAKSVSGRVLAVPTHEALLAPPTQSEAEDLLHLVLGLLVCLDHYGVGHHSLTAHLGGPAVVAPQSGDVELGDCLPRGR